MSDTITCPKCKYEIEVAEALSAHVRVELRKEFDAAQSKKETELEAKWNEERQQLISQADQKAKEQVAVDMQDMQQQLPDSQAKLKASQKVELDLRKERRELEEAKESFELTLNRQLDEERIKIRDKAKKESVEERQLKEAEKDKLISDLGSQIEDLKRKLEQGSQQTQGEVLELELESSLGTPIDAALLAERIGLVVAQNEAMPIRGCFVRLAQPVKIAGDLRVAGAEHSQGAIVVGPAERPERLQWAVVHEIGESIAYRVFATLGVELEVAPSSAREIVANHLASALLLPRMQFAAAGRELDWDLFGLKQLLRHRQPRSHRSPHARDAPGDRDHDVRPRQRPLAPQQPTRPAAATISSRTKRLATLP